jgi:(-)-germacrene D synthase
MQMASGMPASSVFQTSVWSDFFLTYEPQPPKVVQRSEEWVKVRIARLKEDICLLFNTYSNEVERMHLVDAVQRLGIEHLFEVEIDSALSDIHGSEFSGSSLHEVALRFRLLREHGLWVSPDVFQKFKAKDGSFKEDITTEPNALLCLYNAAYTFNHKELELEEAISFARHHLQSLTPSLASPLAEQVKRSLRLPLPRTYRKLEALRYMPEYEQEEGHNPTLLELAKLEFNLLQPVHLKELRDITEWYKDFSGYVELSTVRDRVVECYLWGYTVFYEEECALARMIFAKLTLFITFLDDISDVCATLEEYRKLDTAIQRWDESAISLVPKYLKKFYCKLLSCVKEFEDELALNGKYAIAHIKNEVQHYLQKMNHSFSFIHLEEFTLR